MLWAHAFCLLFFPLLSVKAQVAANHKGIQLMQELIQQYSLPVVHQYMKYIQANAEEVS
jgi:N-methylhydantoinase B/oxoprolinase/acetone carboxylase alpha subunit